MGRAFDVSTALAVTLLRGAAGLSVKAVGHRPEKPLELYDYEGCPYCRKVREVLSALDLEAMIYPCPKGGKRFRGRVRELGGKEQFPFLVDPNTQSSLYESEVIIRHLAKHYGLGEIPFMQTLGPVNSALSVVSGYARGARGSAVRPSRPPNQPLELYSFEASPYCRLVREVLSELEIPYLLHNVAKKSPSREAFVAKSGKMMVPYLVDPNTGSAMFESADIIRYLEKSYAERSGV